MSNSLPIDCPDCKSKVGGLVIANREYPPTADYDPFTIHFLECPICHRAMIGRSEPMQVGPGLWDDSSLDRLWPKSRRALDLFIPLSVRKSIEEAQKCFDGQTYAACAVMCGRSLEALCKHHGAKGWRLSRSLKEMKGRGVIDGRLFDWGEALIDRRNIGAHATGEDISREDAGDVLDFTIAICEYVYVLAEKYNAFKKREIAPNAKRKRPRPL
ncbi:MAG TPA: DUF4145 domain-containing protein [Chthoniobacterales bacterium]|nr:DUF4145 domain-containing protein [Chthoniobacterales bacterium]